MRKGCLSHFLNSLSMVSMASRSGGDVSISNVSKGCLSLPGIATLSGLYSLSGNKNRCSLTIRPEFSNDRSPPPVDLEH